MIRIITSDGKEITTDEIELSEEIIVDIQKILES